MKLPPRKCLWCGITFPKNWPVKLIRQHEREHIAEDFGEAESPSTGVVDYKNAKLETQRGPKKLTSMKPNLDYYDRNT